MCSLHARNVYALHPRPSLTGLGMLQLSNFIVGLRTPFCLSRSLLRRALPSQSRGVLDANVEAWYHCCGDRIHAGLVFFVLFACTKWTRVLPCNAAACLQASSGKTLRQLAAEARQQQRHQAATRQPDVNEAAEVEQDRDEQEDVAFAYEHKDAETEQLESRFRQLEQ